MSGTSHDGVDAALVEIGAVSLKNSSRVKLLCFESYPYPAKLRKEVAGADEASTPDICRLNFSLGVFFAKAANACIETSGIRPDAIASHGQTVFHIPPAFYLSDKIKKGLHLSGKTPQLPGKTKRHGSTLQIGEPSVIAQLTGVPVVAGFRPADMAAGGQGAPLVPFADHVLFRGKKIRAVQNIGGIANVTVVTPSIDDVIAFDTGPGNCLIDLSMEIFFHRPMDKGGKAAASGKPDSALLKKLNGLSRLYLRMPPPKSTGREFFSREFLFRALEGGAKPGTAPRDIVCTLTHFTAGTIAGAYRDFILERYPVEEVILCGGGAKNGFLVGLIKNRLPTVKISLIDEYGIPASAKEAISFAILANETLSGRTSNVPGATGAVKKVVLGGIYLP